MKQLSINQKISVINKLLEIDNKAFFESEAKALFGEMNSLELEAYLHDLCRDDYIHFGVWAEDGLEAEFDFNVTNKDALEKKQEELWEIEAILYDERDLWENEINKLDETIMKLQDENIILMESISKLQDENVALIDEKHREFESQNSFTERLQDEKFQEFEVQFNSKHNTEIFLSYCWIDKSLANEVDEYLCSKDIHVNRDVRDISPWKSIKSFMQSIRNNTFAILLISDEYLKSINCMYEVLEVMKESQYSTKIIPVIINHKIYSIEKQLDYVKYWEERAKVLRARISEIDYTSSLPLGETIKKCEDISRTIAYFLTDISDMNNPSKEQIHESILAKITKVID